MTEMTLAEALTQTRKELELAFEQIRTLANMVTRGMDSTGRLADAVARARGETVVLGKVVGQILARECLSHPDPRRKLDEMLRPLAAAAAVFRNDPEDDDLAIADTHEQTADALRTTALRVIEASAHR